MLLMVTMMNKYRPLVDREIKQFIKAGYIENCPDHLVNPASVNLQIGERLMHEVAMRDQQGNVTGSQMLEIDLRKYSQSRPYMVAPGAFVLTDVKQVLHLPRNFEAQGVLRSSAGRLGFDHMASLYVDPGYHGVLTLEFLNCRQYQRLPIYPGQELVQLRIYRLPASPEKDYSQTGRYMHAAKVEANKDLSIAAY